jgi:subtilisin family serine protease
MFSDENGNCRVKMVWLPADTNGNPPANFDYGTLYTDSNYIKNILKYSSTSNSHATHVLGIAAGTRVQGKKNTYSGVAPKADIVAIELGNHPKREEGGLSITVLESIKYIFQYADSMNKPAVINLSLGYGGYSDHGCDGESLFDLAMNELIDENPNGRIVVVAAGNQGM